MRPTMTTAQLNCNTGIDINKNVCGLTILERTILACYYAGIKNIEILNETGKIDMPESAEKISDLKFKVKASKEKPFKKNSFSKSSLNINVSSIINKEYVIALAGGPEATNQVCHELTDGISYKEAQKALLNSLRKPGEAFSSHYYRYLSLFFTKYLCRTSVTPNMITFLLALIAAAGGLLIINDRWYIYYIGLIMQVLALVFDCVDGEIARIKYLFSKNGDWIDSAGDNACTLFFVIAIAVKNHGIYQTDTSYLLGIISVAVYVLAIVSLFLTLYKTSSSGSLQTITREVGSKGAAAKFVTTLLKRNVVTPILMVLGFFYLTQTILILNIIAGVGLMIFSIVSLIKALASKGVKA
jgi:phosphatidylglycerophosphate synthase